MLAPLNFMSNQVPILVCVPKNVTQAGLLNPGSYRADALPTELLGHLRIQCPQCLNVLLVSHGPSPTCRVTEPSHTQHAIFALF